MHKQTVAALLVAAWVVTGTYAFADFVPEQWLYTKDITLPMGVAQGTLVGAELDSEVFAHARRDLGDLRVINERGVEVPYVLRSETAQYEQVLYTPAVQDLSYVPGSHTSFVVDFGGNVAHNELTIVTPSKNFRRQVTVSGSNDRASWQVLSEGQDIYDYSVEFSARDLTLTYPESLYRYVLVRIEDGAETPLEVRSVQAERVAVSGARRVSYAPLATVREENKQTVITIDLGQRGLETDKASFSISSQNFERYVSIAASDDGVTWYTVGSDMLYSYRTSKVASEKTYVQYRPLKERHLRFTVSNYDNQPLVIGAAVTLEGLARSVVFLADANTRYGLYYGYADGSRPRYDFESVYKQFDEDEIVRGTLGAQRPSPLYKAPEPPAPPVVPWTEKYASTLISIAYAVAGGLLVFLMMTIARRSKEQIQVTAEVKSERQV